MANKLVSESLNGAVSGLNQTLNLMVTGVEEIVIFLIDTYNRTYVCLLTLAIRGSLDAAISAAEDIGDIVNSTLKTIESGIQSDVQSLNSALDSVESKIEDASNFLGLNINLPKISIPAATALNDFVIPSSYDEDLQKLNKSIPTLDEIENATNSVLREPFEKLKV